MFKRSICIVLFMGLSHQLAANSGIQNLTGRDIFIVFENSYDAVFKLNGIKGFGDIMGAPGFKDTVTVIVPNVQQSLVDSVNADNEHPFYCLSNPKKGSHICIGVIQIRDRETVLHPDLKITYGWDLGKVKSIYPYYHHIANAPLSDPNMWVNLVRGLGGTEFAMARVLLNVAGTNQLLHDTGRAENYALVGFLPKAILSYFI